MQTALFIAFREMQERRNVLAAALVAGLIPFVSPLLPGVSSDRVGEAREALASVLALGFGLVLALLLGGTAIARDLAEDRLGFDFSRPMGGLAIWAGRLGAAIVLTFAAMAIVLAPVSILSGRLALADGGDAFPVTVWTVTGAVLLLVGGAHAASIAFRSRSRWLVLDLLGIVTVLLVTVSGLRRIFNAYAFETAYALAVLAVVTIIPALWIASAVQLTRGRTDIVRGHRAQAVTLWSILLVVGLSIFGYSLWFVASDVDDLVRVSAEPAPRGGWVTLDGSARGRPGISMQFLFDTESGRSLRLGPGDLKNGNATLYSADGRRAVWVHPESPLARTINVSIVDLEAPEPRLRETSIVLDQGMPIRVDLSPSGTRLATLQGRNLAVLDLESGRVLAPGVLDRVAQGWGRMRIGFVDDNRVRVYTLAQQLIGYEMDVAARTVTSWSGPEFGDGYRQLAWNADHDRLLLSDTGRGPTLLLDGTDGATIAEFTPSGPGARSRCSFLADGRIARIAWAQVGSGTLELFAADGEPEAAFDLGSVGGPRDLFWLGGEAAPGELLIGRGSNWYAPDDSGTLMLIDLATGQTRELEGSGVPVAGRTWIAQAQPARPGSVAARLVKRRHGIWLVDTERGTLRHVAGRDG